MEVRVFITHGTARPQYITQKQRDEHQNRWLDDLIAYLEKKIGARCRKFLWPGTISSPWKESVIERCTEELVEFFELGTHRKEGGPARAIIAKSNGAQVVENALDRLERTGHLLDFEVEIRLASPLRGSKEHANRFSRRFLLVSDRDLLYKVGRILLRPFFSKYDYEDPNQYAIHFPLLNHNNFNHNCKVLLGKKTYDMYDIYARLLAGDRL